MTATEAKKVYEESFVQSVSRQRKARAECAINEGGIVTNELLRDKYGYDIESERKKLEELRKQYLDLYEQEQNQKQTETTATINSTQDESKKLVEKIIPSDFPSAPAGTAEKIRTQARILVNALTAQNAKYELEKLSKVQSMAEKYIKSSLNNMMDKDLESVLGTAGLSEEETFRKINAIIRGYIGATYDLTPEVIAAKADISTKLLETINNETRSLMGLSNQEFQKKIQSLNEYASITDRELGRIDTQLEQLLEKTNDWSDQKSVLAADSIMNSIDRALDRGIDSVTGRINDSINGIPIMKEFDAKVDVTSMISPALVDIKNNISKPLQDKIKPYLQNNVSKITSTVAYASKRIAEIKKAEDAIKNEIKAQEEIARQYAEQALQAFASDIASKINIDVGTLTGGSGIKLGF